MIQYGISEQVSLIIKTNMEQLASKADEMELSKNSNRERIKQQVSVPFLWEEKPGTPKKEWKPTIRTVNLDASLPVKLVPSVPFGWEEKPGTPLPCFSKPPSEAEIHLPPEKVVTLALPPVYSQYNDNDGHGSLGNDSRSEDEEYRAFDSDIEAFSFETDESFSSAPSLPVTVWKKSLIESNNDQHQTLSSPASDTESSTSSYATGTTSLVGASFLECLFPLLSPETSFLKQLGCPDKSTSYAPMGVQNKDLDHESNCSVAVRRPTTLGELIMMSRRRSYQRKAVQLQRQNLSMESMKNTAVGCCIFGINNRIEGLQRKWKRQLLRLKLM